MSVHAGGCGPAALAGNQPGPPSANGIVHRADDERAHDGGVFYAISRNLIDWSIPAKLMSGSGEHAYRCGDTYRRISIIAGLA